MSDSAASAVQFHDQLAATWEQKYARRSFQSREAAIGRYLNDLARPEQQWLDAGCGTGRLSRLLADRGCKVVGVDAAPAMIARATSNIRDSDLARRINFRAIEDIETMSFERDQFDGVLCISVLEYLNSPSAALDCCAKALRSGGVLIAAVPNRHSVLRQALRAIYRLTRSLRGKGWPEYLQYSRHEFSPRSFRQLLDATGFELERWSYFGGPMPGAIQNLRLSGPLMMCVARKR